MDDEQLSLTFSLSSRDTFGSFLVGIAPLPYMPIKVTMKSLRQSGQEHSSWFEVKVEQDHPTKGLVTTYHRHPQLAGILVDIFGQIPDSQDPTFEGRFVRQYTYNYDPLSAHVRIETEHAGDDYIDHVCRVTVTNNGGVITNFVRNPHPSSGHRQFDITEPIVRASLDAVRDYLERIEMAPREFLRRIDEAKILAGEK